MMKFNISNGVHYSKYCGVRHSALRNKGVFDGTIDNDSLLHIDPMLLKNSSIPEFNNAYNDYINYFKRFVTLSKFLKSPSEQDCHFRKMVEYFTFSEIPNTGLGFSEKGKSGSGISGKLSKQLALSAYTIISEGHTDLEIFSLLHLFEDNIGADRISDMIISILRKNFLSYTQRVCSELSIDSFAYEFDNETYKVPFYNNKPIYFIPESFLTELKVAKDWSEIDDVCDYNKKIRRKVCKAIQGIWEDMSKMNKKQFKDLIISNKTAYNTVLDYAKSIEPKGYDFIQDNCNEYFDLKIEELVASHPLNIPCVCQNCYTPEQVYSITKEICTQFKHLVEDNRMYKMLLKDNGKSKRESVWQLYLYSIAQTYLRAGHINISVDRESDSGAGELDFKFSQGQQCQTIVEIKLSDNPDLLHGYKTQLPQYVKAENADHALFIVIIVKNINKKQFYELLNIHKKKEKGQTEILFIDARPQKSASNL